MTGSGQMIRHLCVLSWLERHRWWQPAGFMLLGATLLHFALQLAPKAMAIELLPALFWLLALLASILSAEHWLLSDVKTGVYVQIDLSPFPSWWYWVLKIALTTIIQGTLLLVSMLLLCVLSEVPATQTQVLLATLCFGVPALMAIACMGAGLTMAAVGGQLLLSFIVLPLYLPVLLLATGCLQLASQDLSIAAPMSALLAFGVLMFGIAPFMMTYLLKYSISAGEP